MDTYTVLVSFTANNASEADAVYCEIDAVMTDIYDGIPGAHPAGTFMVRGQRITDADKAEAAELAQEADNMAYNQNPVPEEIAALDE